MVKGFSLFLIIGAFALFAGCEQDIHLQPPAENTTSSVDRPDLAEADRADLAEAVRPMEEARRLMAARTAEVKAMRQSQPATLAKSKPGKLTVPDQYPTIQAAVDAAAPGAQIIVKSGTYNEVVLLKSGIALIGKGKPAVSGFEVIADTNVVIRGFTVNGSGNLDYGILLSEVVDFTLKDNTIMRPTGGYGILMTAHKGKVLDNHIKVDGTGFGMLVSDSYGNTIQRNVSEVPSYWGMAMYFSDDNKVHGNKSAGNEIGIAVYGCSRSTFTKNQFSDNLLHGMVVQNVFLSTPSDENLIGPGNKLERNGGHGLYLTGHNNTVKKNIVLGNAECDIYDEGTGNVFSGNKVGCLLKL